MRGVVLAALLLAAPEASEAQVACEFTQSAGTWVLNDDCITTASIEIPDGVTLDGNYHTIFAIDPPKGTFQGGIVVAREAEASVINLTITTILLADVCQTGAERLRGILFDGASGTILGNTVVNVNKGASSCAEGSGIELRNSRSEGPRASLLVERNLVDRYQKTGILVHGNVDAVVRSNVIGASATQETLIANAVQVGSGALATIERNLIAGNSFWGADAAATAILLNDSAAGTRVAANDIIGNADVGIYVFSDDAVVEDNDLVDAGPDGFYDVGIVNVGSGNTFIGNTVQGYRARYHRVETATGNLALRIE